MTLRVFLIVLACACAFVAMILGFDVDVSFLDDGDEYPGWVAAALFLFIASHLPGGKP